MRQLRKEYCPPKANNISQWIKKIICSEKSQENFPKKLMRVAILYEKNQQTIELLTNNFSWSADTINQLYKARWTIEIFFRDIKQLLKIKTFLPTSENAVKIQLWAALITTPLLKDLRNLAIHKWYLSNLVAFIRLNLFMKIVLFLWLDNPFCKLQNKAHYGSRGVLF